MERAVEAVLLLPAASVKRVPATEIEPVPDCVLAVGVKTTEYTVEDVVVSVPMLPPEKVMSPTTKSDEASDNVNVTVSVWLDFKESDPARVMVTVGAVVSTLCVEAVLTALWANVALLAAVSRIVPEFNSSESAAIAKPSASLSPEATV